MCPVYIDFGEEILCRLKDYDQTRSTCVQLLAKRRLIHDAMVEERGEDIATRIYPISSLSLAPGTFMNVARRWWIGR